MLKKVLIIAFVLILTGCFFKQEKFYLDNKYYNEGKFINVKASEFKNEGNYVLYTYNSYCNFPIPCEDIFKEFMEKHNMSFLSMPFEEFRKTELYKKIKYAPSIIIVNEGKIVSYLDADSDDDANKYQDTSEFEKWISSYIYFEKKDTN
ncbi:MAG: hypothetical protein IKG27_05845 [Bacilli bacterium]|nr:hypothetical protein [Bacilli bacterium]